MDNEDNEDTESRPMSMEEFRLTHAKEFFEAAVHDEQEIIKVTRNEVDSQIFSQSDTTATTATTANESSDSYNC